MSSATESRETPTPISPAAAANGAAPDTSELSSPVRPRRWVLGSDPLNRMRRQYFVSYAVMGSLIPFLALFLKQQGLQPAQIGYVMSASNFAVLLTPPVMTLLSDRGLHARYLLAAIFAVSSLAVAGLHVVQGFWPTLALVALHSFSFAAMIPLQDGLNFGVQEARRSSGQSVVPYHLIRVWGTLGFILPSIILFFLLHNGAPIQVVLTAASLCGLLGFLNSLRLPRTARERTPDGPEQSESLPTTDAMRALLRRPAWALCASMMLAHMASTAFYGFYPLYLTEVVGVQQQWAGIIFNVGVVVEIGFMLAYGHLFSRLGFRQCMMIGILCMGLRQAALAAFPTVAVAVGTQLLHGIIVLALTVAPIIYLNQQASSRYRNSIQGVYAMAVTGVARIVGTFMGGHVAEHGLRQLFAFSGVLAIAAAVVFLLGFREEPALETDTAM